MVKRVLWIFIILLIGLGLYVVNEFRETKTLVGVVLNHKLDASFYIRQFRRIDDAKDLMQLKKATKQTLLVFQMAQPDFERLYLMSPRAKAVRYEYLYGIKSLQNNIKQMNALHNKNDVETLKKEIKKSEQILLNARERLFNLSEPYMLAIQLKMG